MPQTQPPTVQGLLPAVAGMFVVSLVLGMAYNSASPLGVRPAGAPEKTAAVAPPVVSAPRTGYGNETIAVSLGGVSGAQPPAGSYGNQTMAVGLAAMPGPAPSLEAGGFPDLTWPETKALLADTRNLLVDARVAAFFEAG